MKIKYALFITSMLGILAVFSLGCAAPTATVIYPQATVMVTVTQPAITVPVTTYPPNMGLVEGDLFITIGGGYADATASVVVDQKFEWVNYDHEAHTVTATGEYAGLFDFTLQPGQAVEYSFSNADIYQYYDKLHPGESATIIVENGTLD